MTNKEAKWCIDYLYGIVSPNYQLALNVAHKGIDALDRQVKGEWIIDGHHIRCNRCDEYLCNTDREGNEIPNKFCPNCGADMRGKDNG